MTGVRRYLHPFLDSDRWSHYQSRDDDIIIATPFKSGTTWMQMIILGLIHGIDKPPLLREVGHWIDFRLNPEKNMVDCLEKQSCRRFIKTHLPFDAIPYHKNVKYLVVDRDPRDVFMSLWNHYYNMDVNIVNRHLPSEIKPIPTCPECIHEFWEMWLTKGYFEWEVEGYPFWSNLRHVQSWFDIRDADNILHVHYNNLLSDSVYEINKIANYIGVNITNNQVKALADYTSLKNVKTNIDKLFPGGYKLFKNGADTFFHKGVNGRWKNILTEKDEELYHRVSNSIIDKDCSEWLTSGTL
jgi:aryl sulfotransferase